MKKELIGLFILIFLIGASLFVLFGSKEEDKDKLNSHILNYETKTSESAVTIGLTPKEHKNGKLYVDIEINTHTVDLSQFDLTNLVTLKSNTKSINPSSAPELSGHHISGTLIFDIENPPSNLIIEVRGFPDIPIRTFEW